jgi:hypothetical protein
MLVEFQLLRWQEEDSDSLPTNSKLRICPGCIYESPLRFQAIYLVVKILKSCALGFILYTTSQWATTLKHYKQQQTGTTLMRARSL